MEQNMRTEDMKVGTLLGLPAGAVFFELTDTFLIPNVGKIYAAIGPGGWVKFTVTARNTKEARGFVRSLKRNSETIEKVRLLHFRDMPSEGREFPDHRGG
jgi:hypothetical protein